MQMANPGYIHTFSKKRAKSTFEASAVSRTLFLSKNRFFNLSSSIGNRLWRRRTNRFARKKYPELLIYGIDWTESQIQRAALVLADVIANDKASLAVASAYRLPFPDHSYDGVCTFCVLEHTDHPMAVLNEAYRVLKPKGVFYCCLAGSIFLSVLVSL